jgi:DNA-binding transcriptional regulator YdaS (Cro superfamily)
MNAKPRDYLLALSVPDRQALAARCGIHYGHLRNVMWGARNCSVELAIAIERETGGKVKAEHLCPGADWTYIRSMGRRRKRA